MSTQRPEGFESRVDWSFDPECRRPQGVPPEGVDLQAMLFQAVAWSVQDVMNTLQVAIEHEKRLAEFVQNLYQDGYTIGEISAYGKMSLEYAEALIAGDLITLRLQSP